MERLVHGSRFTVHALANPGPARHSNSTVSRFSPGSAESEHHYGVA